MKRDHAVARELLDPDGENWFRFTLTASNTSVEPGETLRALEVTIPTPVQSPLVVETDWQFFVRDEVTDLFRSSDFDFEFRNEYTLNVTVDGSGTGSGRIDSVSPDPDGTDCGDGCYAYRAGADTVVTVTTGPDAGSVVVWDRSYSSVRFYN